MYVVEQYVNMYCLLPVIAHHMNSYIRESFCSETTKVTKYTYLRTTNTVQFLIKTYILFKHLEENIKAFRPET